MKSKKELYAANFIKERNIYQCPKAVRIFEWEVIGWFINLSECHLKAPKHKN